MGREIIYVADPMCSWCWGFSPAISRIKEEYEKVIPISVVMGGLRVGNSGPIDDEFKKVLRHHWDQVNQMTGQPFSYGFFEREDFSYNTGPSCIAAVTVRNLKPEATLPYLHALHHAFYAENEDITKFATLSALAVRLGVRGDDFANSFKTAKIADETLSDFRYAHKLGVTGFPSVLLKNEDETTFLSRGYSSYEKLKPLLDSWLDKQETKN